MSKHKNRLLQELAECLSGHPGSKISIKFKHHSGDDIELFHDVIELDDEDDEELDDDFDDEEGFGDE
ncbi:hypothetical protein ACSVDE_03025 [Pseudalkalibacillus sp. Hm43]|uniref:hypothetical protein n=1 Tax=Pseudalkalibacillus sp. Hm43 TaxID=3450742 RepID=UPI003F43CB15